MNFGKTLCVSILLGSQLTLAAAQEKTTDSEVSMVATKRTEKIGVNVEPLWVLLKGLGAKVEYFTTETVSVGIGGIFIPEQDMTPKDSDGNTSTTATGYRWSHNEVNLGTNIMLSGTLTTNGAYINPTIGYQNTSISNFGTFRLQGSLNSPQAGLTAGYQWINPANNIHVGLGGGLRFIQSSDVVIKDSAGLEVYRQKSSNLGGLALDLHLGFIF